MNKNHKKTSLLYKQNKKNYNVYNMKPFVKLTKKQYRSSARHNYIFALEYKKKLYRQNIINNVFYNSFQIQQKYTVATSTKPLSSLNTSFFLKNKKKENTITEFKKSLSNVQFISLLSSKKLLNKPQVTLDKIDLQFLKKYHKFVDRKKYYYIKPSLVTPFSSIASYGALLLGSSLWAIQRQTTALRMFPQSSAKLYHSLDTLEQKVLTLSHIEQKNINKKNKLWTAGFVRIRKLRHHYTRQLQNTRKLFYWYSYPSYKTMNQIFRRIYHKGNYTHLLWSIISLLDSLWSNTIIKSNYVYNSSASCNQIKQKKLNINGVSIQRNTFGKPGDIFFKT